ncbi:MAG: hypothetical protein GY940_01360, partial [bacterium]|nr:hypothetical protein [bacterium]
MFILGLLAFFQTVFIPGFILLKYINLVHDTGNTFNDTLRRLVYGFGLSLLINYLFAFYLTLTGLYTPLTLYIILFIEAGLLIYYRKYRKETQPGDTKLDISRRIASFKTFLASNSLLYNLLFFLSLSVILLYVFYFLYFLGTIFMHWDPAVAWNRFAIEWSNNQFPTNTWRYPQLMPSNWSVSYVMMQSAEVQLFAKSIMPLFSIGTLLLFLNLALQM